MEKELHKHFGLPLIQAYKYFFPISLSYVRPGTRFDLTCSPFGRTKREERMTSQLLILMKTTQLLNEWLLGDIVFLFECST